MGAKKRKTNRAKVADRPEGEDAYGRVAHELVNTKDKGWPFETAPDDFSTKKHQPLKKTDFREDWFYHDWKAIEFDRMATQSRERADVSRKMGTGAQRKDRGKLLKLRARMAELAAALEADGVDVEALLAETNSEEPTVEEPVTAEPATA